MRTYEIRYPSESFGLLALYGRYPTAEAANAALTEFRRRAKEYGANRLAQAAHVRAS